MRSSLINWALILVLERLVMFRPIELELLLILVLFVHVYLLQALFGTDHHTVVGG